MKTAPVFDQVLGESHGVDTKVILFDAADVSLGEIPIEDGTVTGNASDTVERWTGQISVADLSWVPLTATHPLAGLTGAYVSIRRGVLPYGSSRAWVEVARLWVYESTVVASRSELSLQVELRSPASLIERATERTWTPKAGETCQAMAVRVLKEHLPFTPVVLDTSTATPVPSTFEPRLTDPLGLVEDLMAIADARVYFDALGRIVIRPTLPALDVAPLSSGRSMSTDLDITRYEIIMGRAAFTNQLFARYTWTDANGDQRELVGSATLTGPLAPGRTTGRLSLTVPRSIQASQAQADTYAKACLVSVANAWCQVRITAVQDPRIEPDDIIDVQYMDRTLRHRVISVQLDLRTDAMQLGARTALPVAGAP